MMSFDSLEWVYITGRGWVAVVRFEGTTENWNPGALLGQQVYVDGWQFEVRGVEMTRQMIHPGHPYRGTIGLLVP